MRTIAFWLSLFFIFTLPWEEMVDIGNFGTVGRLSGVLLAAFWVVTVVVTNRFRKPRPFHVIFCLFILWHMLSIFWTIDTNETVNRLPSYIQLVGMVYIIWDLYTTPTALKRGLQAYVLGAYVSIISLMSNYFAGNQSFQGRFTAAGFDHNNIGIILTLGIPIAWYLATAESNSKMGRLFKVVNFIYIPSAILATFLTGSRGALIATSAAILYIITGLSRLRLSFRVVAVTLLIGALFVLQPLIPEETIARLYTTRTQIVSGDLNGRYRLWVLGFSAFEERPILGYGSFAFRATSDTNNVAHNSFLTILVELGLIGFGLFAILMIIVVYQALHLEKSDARLWLTMLMILAIGAFTLNWAHRKQFWIIPSLIIANAGIAIWQYSQSRSEDDRPGDIPTVMEPLATSRSGNFLGRIDMPGERLTYEP